MSLLADGELSRFEQARLARHLHRCGSCRAFKAELSALTAALRTSPLERPRSPTQLPRGRRPRLRPLLAAAAVAIAAVGLSGGLGGALSSEASSSGRLVSSLLDYYQLDLVEPGSVGAPARPGVEPGAALVGIVFAGP